MPRLSEEERLKPVEKQGRETRLRPKTSPTFTNTSSVLIVRGHSLHGAQLLFLLLWEEILCYCLLRSWVWCSCYSILKTLPCSRSRSSSLSPCLLFRIFWSQVQGSCIFWCSPATISPSTHPSPHPDTNIQCNILDTSEPKRAESGSGQHRQQEEGRGVDEDVQDAVCVESDAGGAAALGGCPRQMRAEAGAAEGRALSIGQHREQQHKW